MLKQMRAARRKKEREKGSPEVEERNVFRDADEVRSS